MIYFFLGLIVGILVRDIKCKSIEITEQIKNFIKEEKEVNGSGAQFIESVSAKEKFDNAKTIDDIIENFNRK